ncbi:hypothetical protein BKA65DRAFT_91505 [Rhexocercosporidium sp. MPI-PUGE-AT-0058]|nr:hypothetical protein BKA65DRAFT_91505 [Rhexocercosporidium sp. MPI-PUGE-AT-0058]
MITLITIPCHFLCLLLCPIPYLQYWVRVPTYAGIVTKSFQLTGSASPSLPPDNLNSTISSISSVSSAPTTASPGAPPTTPGSLIGGVVGGIVVLIGTIVVGTYIYKRRAAIKRKETARIKERP